MGPEHDEPAWARLFDELADLPAGDQSARLAAIEREQPTLAAKLRALLAAETDDTTAALLAGPVLGQAPRLIAAALKASEEGAAGMNVGPYRLLKLLGKGGMGEVWLAERVDGMFQQRVAVKLLKRGMDSEEIIRRFDRERRILARLEHPGIARIFDGGTAPDGRPFFVLERVDGEPITQYCAARSLPLRDRIRLMIEVCEAVHAAHRNLVVHRDLKPSNLLVTGDGQVKLLDFGIAKLLETEAGGHETQVTERALTPAYAAPEQILGEPITTATDVYALGIVLYELLTGKTPHRRENRSLPTLVQEVTRETIERPSVVLREAEPPQRLSRTLAGDLDTVVLKALQRDPDRRYQSAADLADDLARFLDRRPIRARPENPFYRARKFFARNRLTAAAAALVLLSLVIGLALALWQGRIARNQARRAERVKELLLDIFKQADPSHTQGDTLTAREILDQGVRRVETELKGEPALAAELLDTIAQIDCKLGLLDEAKRLAERGLAERRRLAGASAPETGLSWLTLAEVEHERGEIDRAAAALTNAREILEASFSARSKERTRLAWISGLVLAQQGRLEEALVHARQALADTERRFGPEHPETARYLLAMGDILGVLSRFEEGETTLRRAVAIFEHSASPSGLELSKARRSLAEVLERLDQNGEAETLYASALADQRTALGAKHPEVAQTLIKYGFLLEETHRYPEAEKALREAHAILAPLGHYDAASALRYLGFCYVRQERYQEAAEVFAQAERIFREKLGSDHPMTWAAVLSRAQALAKLGQTTQAEAAMRRVLERFTVLHGPESDEIRAPLKSLGELLRSTGRPDEALALHRRARAVELELFGTAEHAAVALSDYQIALDLLARPSAKNLAEARRRLDAALATLERLSPSHPTLDEGLLVRGRLALDAGDVAQALADFGQAVARLRERRGEDHPRTREAEELLSRARSEAALSPPKRMVKSPA